MIANTKSMTSTQACLLATLRSQFGTRKAGGIIPLTSLDNYDWGSVRGIIEPGLIDTLTDADGAFRYKLTDAPSAKARSTFTNYP